MKSLSLSLLLASSLLFSGCCGTFCKPEVIYETKYIKQKVPPLPQQPHFEPYDIEILVFNNRELYAIDPVNAAIMGANWESYKAYSKKLESILINLDSNTTINTK